jgi:hypothetical protein
MREFRSAGGKVDLLGDGAEFLMAEVHLQKDKEDTAHGVLIVGSAERGEQGEGPFADRAVVAQDPDNIRPRQRQGISAVEGVMVEHSLVGAAGVGASIQVREYILLSLGRIFNDRLVEMVRLYHFHRQRRCRSPAERASSLSFHPDKINVRMRITLFYPEGEKSII